MSPRRRSIRTQLMLMSALCSACALLLACAAFLAYEFVTFRRSMVDDLTTDARMLAVVLTAPLLSDDPRAATSSLEVLRAKPRILSATLTTRAGTPFAAYGPAPPGALGPARQAHELWYRFEGDRLLLGLPILSGGSVVGTLTLESSLAEHDRRVRQYLLLTGSILVLALLGALGLSSRLQRRIIQPITRLTDAVRQVSENADYSVRVGAQDEDELGALARTFDGMLVEMERQHGVLRASEERYRHLFESSPLPMWVYDLESLAFLAVNDTAVRHYGYSRDEFLEMTIKDIRPPEDVGPLLDSIPHLPDLTPVTRWRHRKKDGTIIIVEISSHAFAQNGTPARLVLANDITARERADEALRRSEAQLDAVFEAMGDGVVVFDMSGNAVLVNEAEARINGFASAEEMKRNLASFAEIYEISGLDGQALPPEEWPASRVLRGESVVNTELVARRRDTGREWLFSFSGEPVRDARGTQVLAVVITRDVTERKRLEQVRRDAFELEAQNRRIQEANRLKSEFLANMSHELRTPLNAILGFGELLHDGVVSPDSTQHAEFLGHILKSGRHLLQLINDVLDLAKVEAGKVQFRPESIELEPVIDEVMSVVRAISVEKNIRMSAAVDPGLKDGVYLDPARLKQILYNFLSNALKFTPPGGEVTVRARAEGEASLVIEVQDTGPGIAPQDIGRLFVEFQQLDAGMARHHGGTGLGLALARRLAEAQGGSVGVRSTLGQGSVFHVLLPRRSPAGPTVRQPQRRTAETPGAPSVLVIEDDPGDQAMLVEALSDAGYAVEAVRTGSAGLELCNTRRFDAISLDLLLPDMSGQEVLKRLRSGALNRDAAVVVVTVVAEKGVVAGFAVHDFLPKPIDGELLLSSLGRAGIRPGQQRSVMVVDDDEGSLKLMAAALRQLGFQALCSRDGEEALRATVSAPPAAVVLDLLMPGMTGFEFLDRLRSSPASRLVPVLVWTVKDLSHQEQARLLHSAQAIVRKGHGGIPSLLEELRRFLPVREAAPPG